MSKVIFYYQEFIDLSPLIANPIITHLYVSSIHFGVNSNQSLYIHLNDNSPSDPIHDKMWDQVKILSQKGVKICLMIGGAGGAYQALFSNFEAYYAMLKCCILEHNFISGVDLDIEETVDLINVKKLINRLINDFGKKFMISMSPVQESLMSDTPGLGGFIYKELYTSPEGQYISHFNCQFYTDYSLSSYERIIDNGYPANMVVMGMVSDMFNKDTQLSIINMLTVIKKKYSNFGGVFDWELFDSYPDPIRWLTIMNNIVNPSYWIYFVNWLSKKFDYHTE
jgi:hypothetical protein